MTTLYAEFLPNIKTLTITTVLDPPRIEATALWLTSDRSKLVLEHEDETHRITLPAKISGTGIQHLQLPNTNENQCSNRIPASSLFVDEEVVVPWSASSLGPDVALNCTHCNALISKDKIFVWKDLPSEAWAEMMDLWHCHKPEEPEHSHDDAPAKKGYAAGNKLIAQPGTGFVDVLGFLLAEEDCHNVEVQTPTADADLSPITCVSCKSIIGFYDTQAQGLRLQKLDLSLAFASGTTRSYTADQWFSCHLISAIESQGVRKFVFSSLPYEIWVFSTNLAYSSLDSPLPRQAIKVLYRKREGDLDVETLRASNLHVEMLTLTPRLEKMLLECLQRQNKLLPDSLRMFAGWDAAVLPVFSHEDIR